MRKTLSIVLLAIMVLAVMAPMALAAEHEAAAEAAAGSDLRGFGIALAMSLAIGIAAMGGAIGQGIAVRGAMEGIGRNPGASGKIMTTMIIGLALIESLVIYALVISFTLNGKL